MYYRMPSLDSSKLCVLWLRSSLPNSLTGVPAVEISAIVLNAVRRKVWSLLGLSLFRDYVLHSNIPSVS
jgi:hypothetical protein